MNPLMTAILRSGLISEERLRELKRFSTTIEPDAETESPKSLEEVVALIDDALQSEQYVLMKETDLQVIQQFTATAQVAVLHLVNDYEEADVRVLCGKTPIGEYIIAWRNESIKDMLTNGQTHLVSQEYSSPIKVFFSDVRELFFGDQKAFMVCAPSVVDHADHN